MEVDVSPARAAAGQDQRAYTLHFRHLSWTVGKGKRAKTLLDDLSGYAEPSTLIALMGASGSGKSSLLDILAKRKTQGVIEGSILYDTFPLTAGFARRNVGYVEQSPSLIANLTCEEMLLYTAALQRPSSEDPKRQKSEIFELMTLLGLEKRRDVIVGNEMAKGLSGGETKRVTIALGMIREPAVLFLDEPTSGLDSATANEIMRLVKEIANDNRTVITTIHSPTAYCFSLFDKLFLLSSGKVAFFGQASEVEGFLASVGFSRDQTYTTSEWLVDLLSQQDTTTRLVAAYEESDLAKNNENAMERFAADTLAPFSSSSNGKGAMACLRSAGARTEPRPSVGQEIKSCFRELRSLIKFRTPKNYTDSAYLGARIGDKILFMLVIVSLYYGKGKSTSPSAMQSISSVLFMVVVLPGKTPTPPSPMPSSHALLTPALSPPLHPRSFWRRRLHAFSDAGAADFREGTSGRKLPRDQLPSLQGSRGVHRHCSPLRALLRCHLLWRGDARKHGPVLAHLPRDEQHRDRSGLPGGVLCSQRGLCQRHLAVLCCYMPLLRGSLDSLQGDTSLVELVCLDLPPEVRLERSHDERV